MFHDVLSVSRLFGTPTKNADRAAGAAQLSGTQGPHEPGSGYAWFANENIEMRKARHTTNSPAAPSGHHGGRPNERSDVSTSFWGKARPPREDEIEVRIRSDGGCGPIGVFRYRRSALAARRGRIGAARGGFRRSWADFGFRMVSP